MFKSAFANGFSRGIDLGASVSRRLNANGLFIKSDAEALKNDWVIVGEDIKKNMDVYGNEQFGVTRRTRKLKTRTRAKKTHNARYR